MCARLDSFQFLCFRLFSRLCWMWKIQLRYLFADELLKAGIRFNNENIVHKYVKKEDFFSLWQSKKGEEKHFFVRFPLVSAAVWANEWNIPICPYLGKILKQTQYITMRCECGKQQQKMESVYCVQYFTILRIYNNIFFDYFSLPLHHLFE